MSFMVGGSKSALEKCRPLFETSGPKIQHVGELGAGLRAKLAHQIIISINMMAAYEGMRVGVESGLDPKILEKVIQEGLAQSWIANEWSELSFGPHSQMVFYKDLNLGLKLAHDLGIPVPGAGLAQQLLERPLVLNLSIRCWRLLKPCLKINDQLALASTAVDRLAMGGGAGDQFGSIIRTCAMNELRLLRHCYGKVPTTIPTWRVPPHRACLLCHPPRRKRCTTLKPLGEERRIGL
jgi:hypothetical protein